MAACKERVRGSKSQTLRYPALSQLCARSTEKPASSVLSEAQKALRS